MDSTKLLSLLEQLDDDVDDLEESLAPLMQTVLSETSSKLPLLDKAKLYVMVTYAIESLIFSYLRLHGVNAREHPVFVELNRVKQYFAKISTAENPTKDRTLVPDKQAVARFVKAGLAGNEKYDLDKAEREAKERARAHIRFEAVSKELSKEQAAEKQLKESEASDSDSSLDSSEEVEETPVPPPVTKSHKKDKKGKKSKNTKQARADTTSSSSGAQEAKTKSKTKDKAARKAKHEKKKALLQKKQGN